MTVVFLQFDLKEVSFNYYCSVFEIYRKGCLIYPWLWQDNVWRNKARVTGFVITLAINVIDILYMYIYRYRYINR